MKHHVSLNTHNTHKILDALIGSTFRHKYFTQNNFGQHNFGDLGRIED